MNLGDLVLGGFGKGPTWGWEEGGHYVVFWGLTLPIHILDGLVASVS
jgi:hypothetical protein